MHSRLEADGYMLPVISMGFDYRTPVLYDEEMNIEVMLFDESLIKLHMFYKITTSRKQLSHVTGGVPLCFVDSATRKSVKTPEYFLKKLRSG